MGPLRSKGGLEPAVVIESDEAVVNERGEFFVFGSGEGAGFPVTRVERDFGDLQFDTQRAAVFRMPGGEGMDGREQEKDGDSRDYFMGARSG